MHPKCATVIRLVERAVHTITLLYVSKLVRTVLTTLVRILITLMSVNVENSTEDSALLSKIPTIHERRILRI